MNRKILKNNFFSYIKAIIIIIIMLMSYSKLLSLPIAITIATSKTSQNIDQGSLLILKKTTRQNSTYMSLSCYDTFNTACMLGMKEHGTEPKTAKTTYTIIASYKTILTILIFFLFLSVLVIFSKNNAILLIILTIIFINGFIVSMTYVEQTPIKLKYKTIHIITKSIYKNNNTIIYTLTGSIDNITDISCTTDNKHIQTRLLANMLQVRIGEDMIRYALQNVSAPGKVPVGMVQVSIPYECEIDTDTGRLLLNDVYVVEVTPLHAVFRNITLIVYNNNSISFDIKIILYYNNGTKSEVSATLRPHSSYELPVDSSVMYADVKYDFGGKPVNIRVRR